MEELQRSVSVPASPEGEVVAGVVVANSEEKRLR